MEEGKSNQKFEALGFVAGLNLAIMILFTFLLFYLGDWQTSEYSLIGYFFYLAIGVFVQFVLDLLAGIVLRTKHRNLLGNSFFLSGIIVLLTGLPVGYVWLVFGGN